MAPDASRASARTRHLIDDATYLALVERVGAKTILTLDRRLGARPNSAGLKVVP